MLEVLQQIVLRLVLGNTKRNKKHQMKGSGEYKKKLIKGKEVYYTIHAVNAGMYEGLCSWFYGILKKMVIAVNVLLVVMVAWAIMENSLDEYIYIFIFMFVVSWGGLVSCDLAYQHFERTMWILTKEGVIYSNIRGRVKQISYEEIGEMVRKKKAIIRKGCMYLPYKGGRIPIQLYTELSAHEAIPILNRECGLELPDMSKFKVREKVRKGGMGTGLMQIGMIVFLSIFCFGEVVAIYSYGEIKLYWDKTMWLIHGMADLWMIAIGVVCRIVFYYPTWKFFRPYPCIKVR